MKVKNKWNNRIYEIKCFEGPTDTVTLIRDDGSEFTINQKEYRANYKEFNDGKTKQRRN